MSELDCFTGGNDMLKCGLNDLGAATGGDGLFAILVAGAILTSFYIAGDGGMATPSVLTALLGGIMIPVLPAAYQTYAMTLVLLGLTAALLTALNKYVMSTGV